MAFSVSLSPRNTVLANLAASLGPGESTNAADLENPYSRSGDIQWMTVAGWWDPSSRELQYMGKPASGAGPPDSISFTHYVYDERADLWYRTLYTSGWYDGVNSNGHIWTNCVDPATGNHYCHVYGEQNIKRFNRFDWVSAGKPNQESRSDTVPDYWSNSATNTKLNQSLANCNSMAMHPNLYGAGQPGLVVGKGYDRLLAYRPSTNAWTTCSQDFFSDSAVFGMDSGGGGCYLPSFDRAIVGFGSDGSDIGPAWRVGAGSAGSPPSTADYGDDPPILCVNPGSNLDHGKALKHPTRDRILILQAKSPSQVWRSDDAGDTWALEPYTHPFSSMGTAGAYAEWTCASISTHGVMWGICSIGATKMRLWRPPT